MVNYNDSGKNNTMRKLIYLLPAMIMFLYSCGKNDQTDYKDLLNGQEIVYTGMIKNVITRPGNLAIGLEWRKPSDPRIVKYVIYYNNKADSQVVDMNGNADTIKTVIRGLSEYDYAFTIYSYDADGNRSVPAVVNNAKAYGPIYISTLLNRGYNATTPFSIEDDGTLKLNFITPDTINIATTIRYTDINDQPAEVVLGPDQSSITLPVYKGGTPITYRSSYIPVRNALDVFQAPKTDVFPAIDGIVQCNKSLFQKLKLPYDMDPYGGDTDIDKLWNGSTTPQGFPNLFHSNGSSPLPGTLSFDMGRIYNHLTQIEEIGRDCCNNPADFEVWGIDDLTNAATTLPSNDPGWKAESLSKGWTLLQQVQRTDNGNAPLKVDLISNPPPVRYIRIRVLRNVNDETRYTNISQITLFANLLN